MRFDVAIVAKRISLALYYRRKEKIMFLLKVSIIIYYYYWCGCRRISFAPIMSYEVRLPAVAEEFGRFDIEM